MAVFLYGDFEAPDGDTAATDAQKLARLRLHLAEVEEALSADISADGLSKSHGSLTAKMARLDERRRELEARVGAARPGGRVSYVRKSRVR